MTSRLATATYRRLRSATAGRPSNHQSNLEPLAKTARILHAERMKQPPYSVANSNNRVEAWSSERLPFVPRGWLLDYRRELQSSLRSMKATSTSILYAEYATPDDEFADLENVLLYNVGSGCYTHLARRGIVCRRTPSTDHLHHVRYTSTDPTTLTVPTSQVLATAQLSETPRGSSPTPWWAAFRNHLETAVGALYEGEFGIEAAVGSAWTRAIAPSVKALLDGLIAALHVHDGSERNHVTVALSDVGDGDRLWELLNDPGSAVFGRRRLVRPHGPGIAWNPADERCCYFELIRGTRQEALTVTILAMSP